MRPTIFVSYSHIDGRLVGPVVALLRASQALVFLDADGLQPGKKWRGQLEAAIQDARVVVVFWCHHARASNEVRKEYEAAIAQQKDVLPLLIDDTPLPPELAEYQYIDFREAFAGGHALPPAVPRRVWGLGGFVAVPLIATGGYWALKVRLPGQAGGEGATGGGGIVLWLLAAVIAAGIVVAVRRLLRRLRNEEYRITSSRGEPDQPARVASVIETELLRRTGADTGA
jgi:hypothetical protein